MKMQNQKPLAVTRELAPEFEDILEVNDLASQIDAFDGNLASIGQLERRDFVLGDTLGMAGLLVSLISLMLQIRNGNTFQNEPPNKIIERLIMKLSEETSLPKETREKLIKKLIKKL
ncbi:MAG: hypothetical protein KZQ94_19770 [Candidatus Thiodiazotropha sp. (ex Troendleina suluensis)]|nr:hypothetical protein [Candidatus Thiodiazotropha sp. (ex Troendleina suluensis)]